MVLLYESNFFEHDTEPKRKFNKYRVYLSAFFGALVIISVVFYTVVRLNVKLEAIIKDCKIRMIVSNVGMILYFSICIATLSSMGVEWFVSSF